MNHWLGHRSTSASSASANYVRTSWRFSPISALCKKKHVRRRQRRTRPHVRVVDFIPFLRFWKMRNRVPARHVMCLRVTVQIHYVSPQVKPHVSTAPCDPVVTVHQMNKEVEMTCRRGARDQKRGTSDGDTQETSNRQRSREGPAGGPSDPWRKGRRGEEGSRM